MKLLHLKIITPKKIVLERDVISITAPSSQGEITVLPHHANLFSLLNEGVIKIKTSDNEQYLAIGGGYLETDGEMINILVSRAYGQNEIDQELTLKAIEQAKNIIKQTQNVQEKLEAASLLRRSLIDIKLLKKRKAPRSFSENI